MGALRQDYDWEQQYDEAYLQELKDDFADWCDKKASRTEMLELFLESWHQSELLEFIDNNTIQEELNKYRKDYAKYLLEQSGIELDLDVAIEILGEI